MLPRLNTTSRPGEATAKYLQEELSEDFIECAENLCRITAMFMTRSYMKNWRVQKNDSC